MNLITSYLVLCGAGGVEDVKTILSFELTSGSPDTLWLMLVAAPETVGKCHQHRGLNDACHDQSDDHELCAHATSFGRVDNAIAMTTKDPIVVLLSAPFIAKLVRYELSNE